MKKLVFIKEGRYYLRFSNDYQYYYLDLLVQLNLLFKYIYLMDDLYVRLLLTFIGMIAASLGVTLYFWFSIRHFFYKKEDCYIPNLIFNNQFE